MKQRRSNPLTKPHMYIIKEENQNKEIQISVSKHKPLLLFAEHQEQKHHNSKRSHKVRKRKLKTHLRRRRFPASAV